MSTLDTWEAVRRQASMHVTPTCATLDFFENWEDDARYHGSPIPVPTGALFRDATSLAVFVVEGGVARRRAVDVPRRNERVGLVVKGVQPGERVIVFPGDTVRDGVQVESRNP